MSTSSLLNNLQCQRTKQFAVKSSVLHANRACMVVCYRCIWHYLAVKIEKLLLPYFFVCSQKFFMAWSTMKWFSHTVTELWSEYYNTEYCLILFCSWTCLITECLCRLLWTVVMQKNPRKIYKFTQYPRLIYFTSLWPSQGPVTVEQSNGDMLKYKATKQICEDKREKNNREKRSAVVMFKEKALNTRHDMILPHVTLCVIFLKLIECSAQRLYNRLLRMPFQKKGNSRHCGIKDSIKSNFKVIARF